MSATAPVVNIAPFAAVESLVNRGVQSMLANAVASIGGGDPFGVIFDQPFEAPFGGDIDSSAPVCSGLVELLGGLQRGDSITVSGQLYSVQQTKTDSTGWVVLQLAREVV